MPEKKSNILVPILGTTLVVAGGVAAYLYFKGDLFGSAESPLASAKLVPDEALMATFISADAKAWSQLQQFGTPEAQKLVAKGLQDFNQSMIKDNNIDYEKDIKPWLSSVMFAVLPPNPTQAVQNAPAEADNLLVVIGIKDKISALNFANKLKADKKVKTQEFNYKGEKITETIAQNATGNNKPTYSAIFDDHLVLAPGRKAVELAIDTFKGDPSFATKPGANNLLSRGIDIENPIAQIYLPDYASLVQQAIKSTPEAAKLSPEVIAQLKSVKYIAAGIGVDDTGIRMKMVSKVDPQIIKLDAQPSKGKILARFPAQTLAVISGQGISRGWLTASQQVKNIPEINLGLELARAQLKNYNLDLDKDIFGWMDGEFALAAIESNQGLLAPVGFGGALVFETSDRATAEATLNKLDTLAKNYSIPVAQRNVAGKTVTEWQIPTQGTLLGHGWLDQNTVFVTFDGSVADAIVTNPSQSLENSQSFKTIAGSLPKRNAGYFYLDMDKTVSILNSKGQSATLGAETTAILNSIRGIGMTASIPDSSTSQVEMLLALKRQ